MDDKNKIIQFGKPTEVAPEQQTFDYNFVMKDGTIQQAHGLLTLNPMFAGVTTTDNNLTFFVSHDQLAMIRRVEPEAQYNA